MHHLFIKRLGLLQIISLLVAAGGMLFATIVAQSFSASGDYWISFFAWAVMLLVLVISLIVLPARAELLSLGRVLMNERVQVLIIAGLTVVAFALRISDLTSIPYPFAGDEGSIGLEGKNILSGRASNMFIAGWQSEPSMSFLPWALAMSIFGQNIFGLRILAATVGALCVPSVYLLARSLVNVPVAILSAALLAVMSIHIHFSRIAVNNVASPFQACLVFWLAHRAVKTRQAYWFAATGLVMGLSMYSFVGSRLIAILVAAYLIHAFVSDKTLRKELPSFIVLALVAGLAVLPLATFFWRHPEIAFARVNQIGVFQNGWIEHQAIETGHSTASLMASQVSQSLLILFLNPARHGFYNSPGPLFDPLWSFFLIGGFIFSRLYLQEREFFWTQLWFWSVILFGGAFLVPPPFAERYTIMFPLLALFVALGVWNIAQLFYRVFRSRVVLTLAALGMVFMLAVSSLNFYFFVYTPRHYYTDPNSEAGAELGQYLRTVSRDARVYFMGAPRVFYNFPSITFLSNGLDGIDIPPEEDIPQYVEPGREAIFVALPEQKDRLDTIRLLYPSGSSWQVPRVTKPEEILYYAYRVIP